MYTYYVYSSMETVMNLVVSNDRVAPCPNLDPRECVAMDIVVLEDTSTPSEKIHAPL